MLPSILKTITVGRVRDGMFGDRSFFKSVSLEFLSKFEALEGMMEELQPRPPGLSASSKLMKTGQ